MVGPRARAAMAVAGALLSLAASASPQVQVLSELPVTATNANPELAQNSPTIAVDPTDDRFVALASRVDFVDFDCALHVSGDGGRTWQPARLIEKLPPGVDHCYAPEIAFDDEGTLHYLFVGLHGPSNTPEGVYLTTSINRGPWSEPRRILGPNRFMARMVYDRDFGEHGRLHLVWLEATKPPALGGFLPVPNPILTAHSDDGGRTFSEPVAVADPARPLVVAPAVAVGEGGTLHVAYYDLEDDRRDYQGLAGPTWEGTWSVVVSSSYDGGVTFAAHAPAATALVPPERVMLIFTMPPPAIAADSEGRVWVAWWDARHGDWDVFAAPSTDGGRSFSKAVRVNDDPVGNGRHQYLPALSVGPDDRLHAIFYDRRDDPENEENAVFHASSSDRGRSFGPNRAVSSESFHSSTGTRYRVPSAEGLVEFGSRLALETSDDGLLAAWTDTRNVRFRAHHQDIFATEIITDAVSTDRSAVPGAVLVSTALVLGATAVVLARRRQRR